jgi:hypothetical protein
MVEQRGRRGGGQPPRRFDVADPDRADAGAIVSVEFAEEMRAKEDGDGVCIDGSKRDGLSCERSADMAG